MFPRSFYAGRFFAPRFFPQSAGGEVVLLIGGVFRRAFWSWPRQFARRVDDWGRQYLRAFWSWKRVAQWRPGVASQLEPVELVKAASDSRIYGFNFAHAPEVYDGESVIDAMASGSVSGGSGLTFGSVTVTTTAFDDIPADGGLKCNISGGTAGTEYHFAMVGTTTAGRVLTIPCKMTVVADHNG
jgi:hypothetical protein